MKICFDNEIFWTQRFGAISSRYFYNLIKTLSNNNNLDVKVFAKFYLNNKLDDLSKKYQISKERVRQIEYKSLGLLKNTILLA